jgi:hypothetical protein
VAEQEAQNMLAAGALMGTASVVRAGVGCLELWSQRMPALLALGQQMREPELERGGMAGQFRDELLEIARESSEIALRELRRGVDDLDTLTRPDQPAPERQRRPYKAKP